MRGIPVSEKYRGIESDGIIYRRLVKYHGISCGGIDGLYIFPQGTIYLPSFILFRNV